MLSCVGGVWWECKECLSESGTKTRGWKAGAEARKRRQQTRQCVDDHACNPAWRLGLWPKGGVKCESPSCSYNGEKRVAPSQQGRDTHQDTLCRHHKAHASFRPLLIRLRQHMRRDTIPALQSVAGRSRRLWAVAIVGRFRSPASLCLSKLLLLDDTLWERSCALFWLTHTQPATYITSSKPHIQTHTGAGPLTAPPWGGGEGRAAAARHAPLSCPSRSPAGHPLSSLLQTMPVALATPMPAPPARSAPVPIQQHPHKGGERSKAHHHRHHHHHHGHNAHPPLSGSPGSGFGSLVRAAQVRMK